MKKIPLLFSIIFIYIISSIYSSSAQTQLWSTAAGHANASGAIIKMNLDGSGYTVVHQIFDASGSLVQSSDGKLYGLATMDVNSGFSDVFFSKVFNIDPVTNAYSEAIGFNCHTPVLSGSLVQASNGTLYGMTPGSIFSVPIQQEYNFNGVDGSPNGSLIQATNGLLYGLTEYGGKYQSGSNTGYGVLFSFDPSTNVYKKLYDFNDTVGSNPMGSLMQASNGKLYGMTSAGGSSGLGVLFSFDPSANVYSTLLNFSGSNGSSPSGNLIEASTGKLYGLTALGGNNNDGVLFSYDVSSGVYTDLLHFNGSGNGSNPHGSLMQASNGKLYAMTSAGGGSNQGVLFNYDLASNIYTKLRDLAAPDALQPAYSNFIEVGVNNTTLSLTVFLQGFYTGSNSMRSTLYNLGINTDPTATDTIQVNLWSSANVGNANPDFSAKAILHSNGTATLNFPANVINHSYYIAVKQRNSLETWSAGVVSFTSNTSYDFSTGLNKAYASGSIPSMKAMGRGIYAIYTGDINQDGFIDAFDFPAYDYANIHQTVNNTYAVTDLNGDGFTDAFDFPIYDNNDLNQITSQHP